MTALAPSDPAARVMAMLHARSSGLSKGEPLSPPIVSSAKFKLPGDPDDPHPYGRFANPTVEACEAALSALEDAPCLAFPSGMAACTAALMAATNPGETVLVPTDGYYTVRLLLADFLSAGGRKMQTIATAEMAGADLTGINAVWAETPSNPGLDLCDIAALSKRTQAAGIRLIVDNTTATPLLQQPLELGADLVVSSDTKALAGHSDVLFGHVASRDEALMDKVRQWRKLSGSIASPFDAFLVHRGLMTLDVRLSRMCHNAETLVPIFEAASSVEHVTYPGFGFVIGVTFPTAALAEKFIDCCPSLFPSTSFGGVHTSAERRARWGDRVPEGYVRLSVGCEPTGALLRSLEDSLDAL